MFQVADGVVAKLHVRMTDADEVERLTQKVGGQLRAAGKLATGMQVTAEGSVMTLALSRSAGQLRALTAMMISMAPRP